MGRPEAVVYVDPRSRSLREAMSPALGWLRSGFSVRFVHEPSGLDRALREESRLVVVVCASCPEEVVSRLRRARFPERVVVVANEEDVAGLKAHGPAEEGLHLLEFESTRRLFSRHVCAGLIQSLFTRCRTGLAKVPALAAHELLHDAIRKLFMSHPAKPPGSVDEMAASVHCTHRWLNEEWARLWSEGNAHPHLSSLVKANLFLRGVVLQMDGLPFWKCARLLGVGEDRLRGCYVLFTKKNPSDMKPADLPEVIQRIEEEVFGWLLSGRPDRESER
jgi:hypothetical protein